MKDKKNRMGLLILVFLSYRMYGRVQQKGLSPYKWGLYLFLAWIAGEFIGTVIYTSVFKINISDPYYLFQTEPETYVLMNLFTLLFGILGYVLVNNRLKKYPDVH